MTDTVKINWPRYLGELCNPGSLPDSFCRPVRKYIARGNFLELTGSHPKYNGEGLTELVKGILLQNPEEFRRAAATGYRKRAEEIARSSELGIEDPSYRATIAIARDVENGEHHPHVQLGPGCSLVIPEKGQERAMYPLKR